MEVAFLACFLLIFCSKSLISLGFQDFSTSNYQYLNLSEPKFGGHINGVNMTTRVYAESDRRGLEGKHDLVVSKKAKGKGTYGGGNNAHHPRANKGSTSLSSSICFYMTTAMLNVSLAALMALFVLGVF